MTREEEEGCSERPLWARQNDIASDEIVCPVCSKGVRGDQDVIEAHVDACLADETRKLEERARSATQDLVVVDEDWDSPDTVLPDGAVGHVGNVRGMLDTSRFCSHCPDVMEGTGFHTRDPAGQDVDDEIDIDGDDQEAFGEAQFTEKDIVVVDDPPGSPFVDMDNVDETDSAQMTLRDLIAEGRVSQRPAYPDTTGEVGEIIQLGDFEQMDQAILNAKNKGSKKAIIAALEDKIKQLVRLHILSYLRYLTQTPARSLCVCRPPLPCFVVYVWTRIARLQFQLAVGILVAENVGYGVWDPLSCVQYAKG